MGSDTELMDLECHPFLLPGALPVGCGLMYLFKNTSVYSTEVLVGALDPLYN